MGGKGDKREKGIRGMGKEGGGCIMAFWRWTPWQATLGWLGSVVVGRRTCDREISGSTPGRCTAG